MKRTLSRRSFLRLGAMLTAAAVAAPLIEPAAKLFMAPPGGWVVNREWAFEKQRMAVLQQDTDRISMRFIRQYDIKTDQFPVRHDILYGMTVVQPTLVARISSIE